MIERKTISRDESGIYKISMAGGRCYIGSATNIRTRWNRHRHCLRRGNHHSIKLQRAWRKHGEQAFSFSIVETCEGGQLIQREQFWIDNDRPFFNIEQIAGSSLGRKHSEETRRKIAAIAAVVQKGRKHSEESKAKRSAALKGRKPSPQAIAGTIAACKGRKLSAEHISKISAAGLRMSDETKKKIAASSTGRKQTPDAIARRVSAYIITCAKRKANNERLVSNGAQTNGSFFFMQKV